MEKNCNILRLDTSLIPKEYAKILSDLTMSEAVTELKKLNNVNTSNTVVYTIVKNEDLESYNL